MKYVVMYSGGVGSWAAAKRLRETVSATDMTLLFADTNFEDADLYRFLHEGAANLGLTVTRIADGRTPWEVMRDNRYIGSPRVDVCSRVLKRKLLDKWQKENCDPADTTLVFGIDWTESHRLERLVARFGEKGWRVAAPLCDPPYTTKRDHLALLSDEGISPPSLYSKGFPHNNCKGACVKAGQAQWELLLRTDPDTYAEVEAWENGMREMLGDYSILRDRRGGTTKSLPLTIFRERVAAKDIDELEWGGCGCAIE